MSLYCSIIGSVNAGKSSFCENIKKRSKILTQNITQDIIPHLYKYYNKEYVFLDTPGHDCFNEMRIQTVQMSHIVLMFVDINRFTESDSKYLDFLKEMKKPFILILNKSDSVQKKRINQHVDNFKLKLAEHGFNGEYFKRLNAQTIKTDIAIIPISSITKFGLDNIFKYLNEISKLIKIKQDKGYIIENRMFKSKGMLTQILVPIEMKIQQKILYIGNDLEIKQEEIGLLYDSKVNFKKSTNDMTCYIKLKNEPMPGTPIYLTDSKKKIESYLKKLKKNTDDINKDVNEEGIVIIAPTYTKLLAIRNYVSTLTIRNHPIKIKKFVLSNICLKKHLLINRTIKTDNEVDKMFNMIYDKVLFYGNMKETNEVIASENIYKLFQRYINYTENIFSKLINKFPNLYPPCLLEILDEHIYHKKNPIMFGVKVLKGKLYCNVQLQLPKKYLGTVVSIQQDNKPILFASENDRVCIKINSELSYMADMKYIKTFYTEEEKYATNKYKWLFNLTN